MKRQSCSAAQQKQRQLFNAFVVSRNWRFCEGFWSRIVKHAHTHPLPSFVSGELSSDGYGVADLRAVNEAGNKGEFKSRDSRYTSKKTFALRIGYDGNQYYGYQKQTFCPGKTVEGDLYEGLQKNTMGAGRTDRGVSAVSQVICFTTTDNTVTEDSILRQLRSSSACMDGRLAAFECYRVPKKFHSRGSATWRRYLYLFPLNMLNGKLGDIPGVYRTSDEENPQYDVDVDFLNQILSRIENKELSYNAFAYKDDRNCGEGMLDKCILYKARATVVNLSNSIANHYHWDPVPSAITIPGGVGTRPKEHVADNTESSRQNIQSNWSLKRQKCNDRFAHDTAALEQTPYAHGGEEEGLGSQPDDEVEVAADGEEAQEHQGETSISYNNEPLEVDNGCVIPAICVELVGNRFLRRMVRILTATAIRESSIVDGQERNVNVLVDICNSNDRSLPAWALPGPPLCLAGVGFDQDDMAIYKFMPKSEYNARMQERELKNALRNNLK